MNLKQLRQSKNLTQASLAKQIGICKRLYEYWEHGEREIDLSNAKKLSIALGVGIDAILKAWEKPGKAIRGKPIKNKA
jgi:transcriptional regulator with XRE-family HTH domain